MEWNDDVEVVYPIIIIMVHLIVWWKMNISNFMMVLDTGYLLFVAMEAFRFVILSKRPSVGKQTMSSCIIQELCKEIHHQLFSCPKTNRQVQLLFLCNSLFGKNFRWKVTNIASTRCEKIQGHLLNCLVNKVFLI